MAFPYSYFSCPCADLNSALSATSVDAGIGQANEEIQEEKAFNPRSPRTSYTLYPLDHLMWCEDCHDIRCPRCTIEEIVCWYCPSCLFEVPSSTVKSEGNRCTRNCFNCPACTAPLSVSSFDIQTTGVAGPWILACEYCNWTTLDIDIKFEKPTNIHGQLIKLQKGLSTRTQSSRSKELEIGEELETVPAGDADSRYAALKAFYNTQSSKTNNASNPLMSPSGEMNYNSPSSLARIMSLYTGVGSYGKKATSKPSLMRESADAGEGLHMIDSASEDAAIEKLRERGWQGTTNQAQRYEQRYSPRFLENLRPVAALLRTKRSKRCRTCRHILVKPEAKVQSTRYKIKLVAINYVPSMVLKLLPASSTIAKLGLEALPSSTPIQFLLTVKNPMFDSVKVTLATPSQTPGKFGSRVTILCPQFEIGANTDVWDEALNTNEGKRSSKLGRPKSTAAELDGKMAEAGKVWEKGRNWVTVVVEVVCARIEADAVDLGEDEDVLEIPVFVRIEYEADIPGDEAGAGHGDKEKREKRELAYWCVFGVGKIGISPTVSLA